MVEAEESGRATSGEARDESEQHEFAEIGQLRI
jgi:hypothetical protein